MDSETVSKMREKENEQIKFRVPPIGPNWSYLLFADFEGFQVVAHHTQLLLKLDDFALTSLGTLLSSLKISLNHGQFTSDLEGRQQLVSGIY